MRSPAAWLASGATVVVAITVLTLSGASAARLEHRVLDGPGAAASPSASPSQAATSAPSPAPSASSTDSAAVPSTPATPAAADDATSPLGPPAVTTPQPSPSPTPPAGPPAGLVTLSGDLGAMVAASGAHVGISLIELGGANPQTVSLNAADSFDAASDYKLGVLEYNAQMIAAGKASPNDQICFVDSDYADGWFGDYTAGACYSRQDLAYRAAHYSDNTAAHMLLRDMGGADALNAWTKAAGAIGSSFFEPNTTTAADLAHLWVAEQTGQLGGAGAQGWLYPMLTHTVLESGIPATVPASLTVVHKTGSLDTGVENDAALVLGGPGGAYVLVVLTDSGSGTEGLQIIADVSARVWAYESSRG